MILTDAESLFSESFLHQASAAGIVILVKLKCPLEAGKNRSIFYYFCNFCT